MIPPNIFNALRQMGLRPEDINRETGGDINHAVSFRSGAEHYFLKYNEGEQAARMLEAESLSLRHLAKAIDKQTTKPPFCHIPLPLACQKAGEHAFLLLPYIAPGVKQRHFWEAFGRALAGLHRIAAPQYGFPFDNFIGRLPQSNKQRASWCNFYAEERLLPQIKSAFDAGLLSSQDLEKFETFIKYLPDLLPEERPQLIHGDLWSGNFLCDTRQNAWLIDPAPCYAHREMDLAMSKLFGGFHARFYSAYQEAFPLLPGYGERTAVYQLYYLLVHLNLFGRAYYHQVMQAILPLG